MTERLVPYGSIEHRGDVSKVGKSKSPKSLAERMSTPELAAKVGITPPPTAQNFHVVRLNRAI